MANALKTLPPCEGEGNVSDRLPECPNVLSLDLAFGWIQQRFQPGSATNFLLYVLCRQVTPSDTEQAPVRCMTQRLRSRPE